MPLRDFFCQFIEVPWFGWNGSMAVFEVVKFPSIVKIDLGLFLGDQGIIFVQRLGLSWEWFAVRARWLHHHVSGQILSRDGALLQKFYIRLKRVKLSLLLLGGFRPIYQNCLIWTKRRLGRFSRLLLSNPSL